MITELIGRRLDFLMPISHWFLNTSRNCIQKPKWCSRSHIYCHLRIPLFQNPLVLTVEMLNLAQLIYSDCEEIFMGLHLSINTNGQLINA